MTGRLWHHFLQKSVKREAVGTKETLNPKPSLNPKLET
jgi:hypothetical protein